MCGRFANTQELQRLISRFKFIVEDEGWTARPRYNIAPTQDVLVLRQRPVAEGGAVAGGPLRWGLVPFWADDPAIGARMINARGESIAEKPAFRRAFASRRCLVPADGFFEWRRPERGPKQPHLIRLRGGEPFALAGIWEEWAPKKSKSKSGGEDERGSPVDAAPLRTFALITIEANALVAEIHDRMPVILRPEDEVAWLDPANTDAAALQALLRPYDPGAMEMFPVSPLVNTAGNDVAEVMTPLAGPGAAGGTSSGDGTSKPASAKPRRDDLQPKLF